MKRPYGLYFYTAGMALLTIQFLVILFSFVNNDMNQTELFVVDTGDPTFMDTLKQIWWGIAGLLVFVVMFVRRFVKGPDALWTLIGIMLWVIQILSLRTEGMEIAGLLGKYFLGIAGVAFAAISAIIDIYNIKRTSHSGEDSTDK